VGVHLVLDEYDPVAPVERIRSLVGADGRFPSRPVALARVLSGRSRLDEVRAEWEAQIARVVDAGIRPTHLDGHGHCHASPPAARIVVDLAERFGIPAVRVPREGLARLGSAFSPRRYAEKLLIRLACVSVRRAWSGRLRAPDAFYGFMEAGSLDVDSLESMARSLPDGVSELMAHPGVDGDDRPFSIGYDWVRDLETLTRYSKREFEERFDVQLVSFANAWSESP
jgi:predicted glycoside hydrolase/deacetylase ChbG (UPF0249 family)